ncbi:flippase [Candidatus Falkowbacteria bacterium]|nr:flippase [Candidatus Falkowbacteria bacterium]
MSLTRKIAYNTIIQFIGKILGTLIGVLTIAIMTRYLGQIGFGQYSTIMAYLQLFAILVDMGLSLTVIKLISDPSLEKGRAMNNIFTFRFFSALIFLGLAPLVVIFFPYSNIVKFGIAIASLSFFISSLNQILISLFQKELKLNGVAISEVAGRLILLFLVAYFAFADKGLIAIVWAVVLGSLTNFILNYLFALKFVKIKFAFDWQIWKKIFYITWPLALSIALNLVYFKADTLILSLTRSQAEVGIYNAPYRVLEILVNFIYLFVGIIFPILTAAWIEKNYDRFKDIFQKTFDILLIISLPMVFGTLFVAKKLMLLIAGSEFSASGDVLKIIIVATGIIFINSLFGYTIVTLDKQRKMVWAYVFVALISLIGYLITIPKYGYYGAAVFTVISEAMILIFNLIVTVKTIKFWPNLAIIPKTILASAFMCLGLYFLANLNVILQIILASIIYLIFIYLFKGFSREFVQEILRTKARPELPSIDNSL